MKLNYTPEEDYQTPYEQAKMEYADLIGKAKKEAYNWRMFTLTVMVVLTVSITGNIYLSNKASIIPYIIEVDSQSGAVLSKNKVDQSAYKPQDPAIKQTINNFVIGIRSLSTDPVVVKNNWESAYKLTTRRGRDIFLTYRDQFKPEERMGKEAISIGNMVITKITENSYQADWIENVFEIGELNARAGQNHYTGTFTTMIIAPKNEDQLRINPLGIYVDEFHISKRY